MTKRQRKAKAKVKRASNKRARVRSLIDMETHGKITFADWHTPVSPADLQFNAYANAHKRAAEAERVAVIEAGSFRMPPPGVVAQNPLRPPSKFIKVKGRWFWKSAREYKRDMDRYYDQITQGAFHVPLLRPGMMVVGRLMRADEMGYAKANAPLEKYCADAVKFDCTLYEVLGGYAAVVKRKSKVLYAPRMDGETVAPAVRRGQWIKAFKDGKARKNF